MTVGRRGVTPVMTYPTLIADWCAWLTAAGRRPQTVALRRHQLSRLASDVPDLLAASTDDLAGWLAGHDWAPATLKAHRDAVLSFYGWAAASGRVAKSPAAGLGPVRVPPKVARPAPEDAVEEGLAAADERVRLMVGLAARAGLRRAEIARVHSRDLTRDLVGWSLLVHGKGGRERLVPIPDDLAFMLRRRGDGYAWPGADHGHLSPARVGELVSAALPDGWTCHTLRHRFATRCYAAAPDLLALQELLGHAKPETTRGYVRLGSEVLRSAVSWAAWASTSTAARAGTGSGAGVGPTSPRACLVRAASRLRRASATAEVPTPERLPLVCWAAWRAAAVASEIPWPRNRPRTRGVDTAHTIVVSMLCCSPYSHPARVARKMTTP